MLFLCYLPFDCMKPSLLWDLCFKSLISLSVHFWFHFLIYLLDPGRFHFGERSSRDLPLFLPCCCNWIIQMLRAAWIRDKIPTCIWACFWALLLLNSVYSWTSATALTYLLVACTMFYCLAGFVRLHSCSFSEFSWLLLHKYFWIESAPLFSNLNSLIG